MNSRVYIEQDYCSEQKNMKSKHTGGIIIPLWTVFQHKHFFTSCLPGIQCPETLSQGRTTPAWKPYVTCSHRTLSLRKVTACKGLRITFRRNDSITQAVCVNSKAKGRKAQGDVIGGGLSSDRRCDRVCTQEIGAATVLVRS